MLFVFELDHTSRIDIDQVIMMLMSWFAGFVTRAPATEITALENALLFKQTYGTINRRDRDAFIECGGTTIKLLDVWMIFGLRKHARDDTALAGHFQTVLYA